MLLKQKCQSSLLFFAILLATTGCLQPGVETTSGTKLTNELKEPKKTGPFACTASSSDGAIVRTFAYPGLTQTSSFEIPKKTLKVEVANLGEAVLFLVYLRKNTTDRYQLEEQHQYEYREEFSYSIMNTFTTGADGNFDSPAWSFTCAMIDDAT